MNSFPMVYNGTRSLKLNRSDVKVNPLSSVYRGTRNLQLYSGDRKCTVCGQRVVLAFFFPCCLLLTCVYVQTMPDQSWHYD
jgi:hypothetical protein